jgi:hypothetical protein
MKHRRKYALVCFASLVLHLAACGLESEPDEDAGSSGPFELAGFVNNPALDEISGIETARNGDFYVHNDEGKPLLYVIDNRGTFRTAIELEGARNRDWEDLTIAALPERRWLVAGDIGDNDAVRKSVRLYFAVEPSADADGGYPDRLEVSHEVSIRYPDGPRDCEALAYDPGSGLLLFMTKRDRIPRLYGVPLDEALGRESAELEFLAEVPTLSPPTAAEILRGGKKAFWLSQPTGMDISADGSTAAIITYRSLYLYTREAGESWADAFQRKPREYPGPPGVYEEAVTIDGTSGAVYITTERIPTPLYRLRTP